MNTVEILGVEIDNISKAELLSHLKQGGVVFTPNVDHVVKLQTDAAFRQAYSFATYKVCDSQVLVWVSKLMRTPICEKISGSDLFPAFYNHYKDDPSVKIFLLGSAEGIAEEARARINARVGREIVVGVHSPSFQFFQDDKENREIIDRINRSQATVLAIGVGAPKQEKWLLQHRHRLNNINVAMAIGATIDFEAGRTKRAPGWISQIGLEWLYRLAREPKRLWRRYLLEDIVFFRMLLGRMLTARKPVKSAEKTEKRAS